jgi:DNA/RNA-binding domain of Phe-tRNA-synthetase-like protein
MTSKGLKRTCTFLARWALLANLLKRVQKPDTTLPFINNVVAIMNINSIDGKIPVGGDDLALISSRLELRYADGSESFTPLGANAALEHPDPGEVIYVCADKGEVMCRRWNWRNSRLTAITEQTQTIAINIDGLSTDCQSTVISVRDRIAQMLSQYCGASISTALLDLNNPTFEFFA